MGDLKKVQSGSPLVIPAQTFNAFIDAARDFQERQLGQSRTGVPDSIGDLVLIKNASGADRDRFNILGIDGIVISPTDNLSEFQNRPALSCVAPTEDHADKFVILAEPVKDGCIGRAWATGTCVCRVYVHKEEHTCAYANVGIIGRLKSSSTGSARILWKESGTGLKWAVVRLGNYSQSIFPVNLTQTGGSQGTNTAPASWTYDVIDPITEETLESAVDPTASPHKWQRPSAGWMIAATFGYAHYNTDGELVLGWINEMVEQEACTS